MESHEATVEISVLRAEIIAFIMIVLTAKSAFLVAFVGLAVGQGRTTSIGAVSSPSGRGDLYMMILDSLGKPPQYNTKTNTEKGGSMIVEIELKLKLIRKPKTKKVAVVVENEQ